MNTESAPRPQLKFWQRALFSLLAGMLMALAFLPFDYGFVVWFGLLPLLTILWLGPRRFWAGFFMGWLYGMGLYSTSFWWIHEVGSVFQIPMPVFLGIAFFPLMSYYALLPALWAGIAATLLRPKLSCGPDYTPEQNAQKRSAWNEWSTLDLMSTLRSALGLGALWVCIEWLRSQGTLGFSWNSLGMAMYDGLALVQWAEFVGTSALAFLPVCCSVIIWGAARRCYHYFRAIGKTCRPWDFYGILLTIFMLFMGGMYLARHHSPAQMHAREGVQILPVMAVQINLDQNERIDMRGDVKLGNGLYAQLLEETERGFQLVQKQTFENAHKLGSDQALELMLPTWVIWPESACGTPLYRHAEGDLITNDSTCSILFSEHGLPALRHSVRRMGGQDFVLFAGVDEIILSQGETMPAMLNSMAIMENDFKQTRTVSKQHLMPFGEYIPFTREIEWVGKLYADITGTQTGDGIRAGEGSEPILVNVPGGEALSVIPAICYEDTVAGITRKFARKGAQVIVNITNDGWFRKSACGEQQARAAAFRCIELRRSMVRSANMGVCCSIAPNGCMIGELRDAQGTPWLAGSSYSLIPIDKNADLTIYAMLGDWAVILCALMVIVFSVFGFRKRSA